MISTLAQSLEAILFAVSDPQSFANLAERLNASKDDVRAAVDELEQALKEHGIGIVVHNETVTLATKPEQSSLIEAIRKEELQKELSKASAETLAIVAYYPGATKAQIEFIRGVNASYSLRALSMRGLIEMKGAGRAISYHPTLEMLEHFGVQHIEDLPNFTETRQKIVSLLEREQELPGENA